MHRTVVTTFALMLLAGGAAAGIDNAGTTAGNFLSVGTGASVLSMGGATLGWGGDLNAAAWNPAALARLNATEFALAHGGLADQQTQEWAAAGGRLGHGSTRWALTGLYQGEGGFEGRDALGASTGAFSISNMALGVTFAHAFGDRLTVGIGTQYVNESLGTTSGSALAFDAGVQARAGAFGLGLAARNVGGSMKYDSGTYDLPSNVGAGVSWQHPTSGVRLALDANFPSAYYNDVRMGAEWRWQDRVALRAGYRMELGADVTEQTGGPAFGMGTGVNGVWMDYGYLGGSNGAAAQHRLGLSFHPSALAGAMGSATQPSSGETEAITRAPKPVAAKPAREPKPEKIAAAKPEKPAKAPKPARAEKSEALVAAVQPLESDAVPAPGSENAKASKGEPTKSKKSSSERAEKSARSEKVADPALPSPVALALVLPSGVADGNAEVPAPRTKAPARKKMKASDSVKAPELATVAAVEPEAVVAPEPAKPAVAAAPKVEKPAAPVAPAVRPTKVVVQAGETLADLAKRWETSVARLMMENNLVSETVKPGRALKLPPAGQR